MGDRDRQICRTSERRLGATARLRDTFLPTPALERILAPLWQRHGKTAIRIAMLRLGYALSTPQKRGLLAMALTIGALYVIAAWRSQRVVIFNPSESMPLASISVRGPPLSLGILRPSLRSTSRLNMRACAALPIAPIIS